MPFRDALAVAFREFWFAVRQKGYIILTFGMPLFLVLYIGVASVPALLAEKKEREQRTVGVVDFTGLFEWKEFSKTLPEEKELIESLGAKDAVGERKVQVLLFSTEEEAKQAFEKKEIFNYFIIPADYLETGEVFSYGEKEGIFSRSRWKSGFLRGALIRGLTKDIAETEIVRRIEDPLKLVEYKRGSDGEFRQESLKEEIAHLGLPYGFGILLMMSILIGGGMLLQGIAEEKENRIMEVILSSISARSFFFGKLLGLGSAAFLQLFVWLIIGSIPLALILVLLEFRFSVIIFALAYFVLGFFLYGSLMLGTGALGTNYRESQQFSMLWSIFAVIGIIFLPAVIDDPKGAWALTLSYVPFTSPITMTARTQLQSALWYEHIISIAILLVSIAVAIRLSARVFRAGLLLYGKRPTIKQIWQALKEAK